MVDRAFTSTSHLALKPCVFPFAFISALLEPRATGSATAELASHIGTAFGTLGSGNGTERGRCHSYCIGGNSHTIDYCAKRVWERKDRARQCCHSKKREEAKTANTNLQSPSELLHSQVCIPSLHVCFLFSPSSPHFPFQEPPRPQQVILPLILIPHLGHLTIVTAVVVITMAVGAVSRELNKNLIHIN